MSNNFNVPEFLKSIEEDDRENIASIIDETIIRNDELYIYNLDFSTTVSLKFEETGKRIIFDRCSFAEGIEFLNTKTPEIHFKDCRIFKSLKFQGWETANPRLILEVCRVDNNLKFDFLFPEGVKSNLEYENRKSYFANANIVGAIELKITNASLKLNQITSLTLACLDFKFCTSNDNEIINAPAVCNFENCVFNYGLKLLLPAESRLSMLGGAVNHISVDTGTRSNIEINGVEFHKISVNSFNCYVKIIDINNNIAHDAFFSGTPKIIEMRNIQCPNLDVEVNAQSMGEVNFHKCTVQKITFYNPLALKSEEPFSDYINLSNLKVLSQMRLSNMYFNGVMSFDACSFDHFNANNSKFNARTAFTNCIFLTAPTFYSSKLFPDTDFKGCSFKDLSGQAEAAYRELKYKMHGIQNPVDEHLFSSKEMYCNWIGTPWKGDFASKFFGLFYGISNLFGQSIFLPIIWIFLLTFIGSDFYSQEANVFFEKQSNIIAVGWKADAQKFSPDQLGLWYSIINSLGPLKLHPSAQQFTGGNSTVVVISLLHSILASYLWFLIISWLRRRFRTS